MEREQAIDIRLRIEQARRDLLDRYSVTKSAMRGAFHSALFQGSLPNPKAQQELDKSLKKIGQSAVSTETRSVVSEATKIQTLASASVDSEDVSDRISDFQKAIAAQIGNDARTVSELFRKTQLRLNSTVVPREQTYQQAIEAINSEEVFSHRDAMGRNYYSRHYFVTLSGQFYYDLANDLSVAQIMAENRQQMTLDRPGHESDGRRFRMSDLEVVRKRYLHPGSKGILV